MEILFIIFVVATLIGIAKYLRALKALVKYSNENSVEIFGKTYRSIDGLYADFGFHSMLWNKDEVTTVEDRRMRELLIRTHKLFRNQTYGGLFCFFALLLCMVFLA